MHILSNLLTAKKNSKLQERYFGYTFLIIAICSQAISTPFGKELSEGMSPALILFFVAAVSLIFTLLSFGLFTLIREFAALKRYEWGPLIFMSVVSGALAPILFFLGLPHTNAINAELFLRSSVLFMLFLAYFLLGERMKRQQLFAASAIFFGVLMVALKGFSQVIVFQSGDVLILLSAISYSVGNIIFKKHLSTLHPEIVITSRALASMALLMIFAPIAGYAHAINVTYIPSSLIPALIAYGFIARFLNQFSYYEALEHLPVHIVSLSFPLAMIGSLLFANWYLHEPIHWYQALGGGCIIAGVFLMHIGNFSKKPEEIIKHYKLVHKHHV